MKDVIGGGQSPTELEHFKIWGLTIWAVVKRQEEKDGNVKRKLKEGEEKTWWW